MKALSSFNTRLVVSQCLSHTQTHKVIHCLRSPKENIHPCGYCCLITVSYVIDRRDLQCDTLMNVDRPVDSLCPFLLFSQTPPVAPTISYHSDKLTADLRSETEPQEGDLPLVLTPGGHIGNRCSWLHLRGAEGASDCTQQVSLSKSRNGCQEPIMRLISSFFTVIAATNKCAVIVAGWHYTRWARDKSFFNEC